MMFKRAAMAALLSLTAAGCSLNDHFSGSAVEYNRQAEQVQDQVILLNILRASDRRPFEFSGLQTITGATSSGGSIGLSVPFAQHGGSTASTLSPTITTSAGPTATVGIVDTQDFYEGLLTPISPKLVDLYVQRGLPKVVLFDLFFARIEVSQNGKHIATFSNSVGKKAEFELFQKFVSGLVFRAKLTTDEPDNPKAIGPLLTPDELIHQESFATKAATAGLDIKENGWCELSASELRGVPQRLGRKLDVAAMQAACKVLKNTTGDTDAAQKKVDDIALAARLPIVLYRTQKANTDYEMCFDAPSGIDSVTSCNSEKKTSGPAGAAVSAQLDLTNHPHLCEDIAEAAHMAAGTQDCKTPIKLSFVLRSTYGVIYYLGEVVRQRYHPDPSHMPAYTVGTYLHEDGAAVPLFNLQPVLGQESHFLNVDYDGQTYALTDGDGEAFEVLDLVTELIALNKSAKDLPTTSVITAVGAP